MYRLCDYHLNTGPFDNWTTFNHSNTELVQHSDGYSKVILTLIRSVFLPKREE